MNPMKTENWRAVLELGPDDLPKPDQMRSSGQILAAMMRRGMLDVLDEEQPAPIAIIPGAWVVSWPALLR